MAGTGRHGVSGNEASPPDLDLTWPHPARVYDYWLGGKDNFAIDRQAASDALEYVPEMVDYAVGNRKFMVRAVRFLADAGIRQFLDLGTGLPTSPNVHEVAHAADPEARVVYVDNDPMVSVHAKAILAKDPRVTAVHADFRDAQRVLSEAQGLLDFTRPVAIMFIASLHHLVDHDEPARVVAAYLNAAAPGSYLALSHCTDDMATKGMREMSAEAARRGATFVPRSRGAILAMFNGRELIEPGLVQVSYWRPDGPPDPNANRVFAYGGIARL